MATSLLGVALKAQSSPAEMVIGVRSGVDSADKKKRDHDPAYDHDPHRDRLFHLAHVQEEKSGKKLVKPVDAIALARQVTAQLEAQGFRPVPPGQKPDIIVTVKYGRGYLPNPYTDSDGDKQRTNLSNTDLLAIWPSHDHYVGLEQKRQQAAQESLVIQVRAWKYPPPKDPRKKEELLWMTTIHVDDPEHRDLNEISEKMLAIGAPYFDHHLPREGEVVVNTALPDGHVNVGPVELVKDLKK